ncbi:MAG TPA: hypothetical protein VLH39_04710 [Magnetospirillaceae bacterium]|nr:hypothetical protein [Magnetospirillaceae bacterium]
MPSGLPPPRAPDCLACLHFIVTWDVDYPRGCEVFGIKSRSLPSLEVFAATGLHCPAFEAGPRRRKGEPPSRDGGASGIGGEGIWA